MTLDVARLFIWSGVIWQGALRAYWVVLVVRLTVELDLPDVQLVLLGTAMETSLLMAEIPTGVVADTVSRKWSVVVGFVAVGLAQIAAGLVASFPALVATQIAWGIAYTFRSGADTAWVTDEVGGAEAVEGLLLRRARLQLLVSIVAGLGAAALAWAVSLTTAVVATGVVLIATGVVLAAVMPETGFVPDRNRGDRSGRGRLAVAVSSARKTTVAGARVVAASSALRVLVAVLILVGVGSEAIDRLDVRRLDDLGLSARTDEELVVGAVFAVQAALGAAVLWWSENRVRGSSTPAGMAVLLAAAAVAVAMLGLVAVLGVALAALVAQGALRLAAQPLALTWTNAHTPSATRATVHSAVEQANSLGEIGGGVLLGALVAVTSVPTGMGVSASLLLVAAVVAYLGRRAWSPVEAQMPA